MTPEGQDLLSGVHIAIVANRWGSSAGLSELAWEMARRLPAP